ncbi:signal peptidase I [Rubrobacter radiotolerans]|uniref:Signal peptidase I n=1 Tax=Rubrobacter radiotolerans TaxID=42256 RepID=A0A023WZY1_RUBRA|nr:signal peptidase I [Rubrobacter radiotolerans]AHY45369.1 signal peptidase I [Rubrobacter radiotolerans]MDX5892780.1 signal peptidase I [Rubrobacter radiotolerans]SMC02483.1 signal peptidase I [Rubrobacter radiotolerans DSM 5868]
MSRRGKPFLKGSLELLLILGLSFVLVFGFVRPVVASPVYIKSGSMLPTLRIYDQVLINKLADDLSSPERGEVVLFRDPAGGPDSLIKRVVGLPGETLELREGRLYVNGAPLEEPYVNEPVPPVFFGPVRVPEGHYFVLGDNRGDSVDSRVYGPVSEEALIGTAAFRFWPPGRIGAV